MTISSYLKVVRCERSEACIFRQAGTLIKLDVIYIEIASFPREDVINLLLRQPLYVIHETVSLVPVDTEAELPGSI